MEEAFLERDQAGARETQCRREVSRLREALSTLEAECEQRAAARAEEVRRRLQAQIEDRDEENARMAAKVKLP